MKIDELNIVNVSQSKVKSMENGIVITFQVDSFRYNLYTLEKDGMFNPYHLVHLDENSDCTLCENGSNYCKELMKYKQELFHRLIEFPSIRLEWLYINHV